MNALTPRVMAELRMVATAWAPGGRMTLDNDDVLALLDAAAERDALAAAVERVRALHTPSRWYLDYCANPACECEHVECNGNDYQLVCETCSGGELEDTDDPTPYPCPTIRALNESETDRA